MKRTKIAPPAGTVAKLLTREQAAGELGIGLRTFAQLVADGEIPVVRIGAQVRIRPSAIDYFIEARETRLGSKRRKAIHGTNKQPSKS